jgi:putative DNA primase/helicase
VSSTIKKLAAPGADLIIAADDDGPNLDGIEKANQAALACGGRVALPGLGRKADFWDVLQEKGHEAVRVAIEGAQAPGPEQEPKKAATPSGPVWPELIPFDELPPDLPAGLLPGILGEFTEGIAEAVQAPRELAALNALGVTALCVQNKVQVRVKPDYKETLNIFACGGSEAGERKSGLMSAAKAPVLEWEREQEEKIMPDILAALSTRKTLEKVIEKARAKAASAKTPAEAKEAARAIFEMERELPEVPPRPRLLVDDITPEALAAVMATSGESIGMLEPEGGALDTFAGRYSNSVPNIDLLLKSFCGEGAIVDRKGKEPLRLRQPRLTMILTPQPTVLKAAGANKAFMERGLIARCILILPRPRVGYRDNSKTVDPALTEQWKRFVRYLLDAIPQGQSEISLSPAAYGKWVEFSEEVEIKQRPGGEFEHIKSWASKLTGLVARIAGLFHLAEGYSEGGEISGPTMDRACRFAWWAAEHAKHVYSSFGVDEGQDGAKRIFDWIRKDRRESVTAREIYKALRGRYQKMEQLRPGLDMLVERGAIVPGCKSPASPRGGRPTESYLVNPAIYTQ